MRKGFTLIELMIVIAIIAIIAAIAIPNLLESRVTANESAAAASLKSGIFPGEVSFQGGAYQDADVNNVGEYGTMGALAGKANTTKMTNQATPGNPKLSLLQGSLSNVSSTVANTGEASGYVFWDAIPGLNFAPGTWTVESYTAALPVELAAPAVAAGSNYRAAERYFVFGAMPSEYNNTGRRVFMMCQDGQVRTPPRAVNVNAWYTGAAPTPGSPATIAKIQAGIADAYVAAQAWGALDPTTQQVVEANYPVQAR